VFQSHLRHLDKPLVKVIQAQIQRMPLARRRKINTLKQVKPLLLRLESMFRDIEGTISENTSLKAQLLARRTADEILDSLTDDEIMRHYGPRFMQMVTPDVMLSQWPASVILESMPLDVLWGEANRRKMEFEMKQEPLRLTTSPTAPIKQPVQVALKKAHIPTVLVCGLMPAQQQSLRQDLDNLCELRFLDKGLRSASDVPEGMDFYVAWSRFLPHDITSRCKANAAPGRFLQCTGGITKMIHAIKSAVKQEFYKEVQ
jgi:hypothetical protein